jgi:hypothetical protein
MLSQKIEFQAEARKFRFSEASRPDRESYPAFLYMSSGGFFLPDERGVKAAKA